MIKTWWKESVVYQLIVVLSIVAAWILAILRGIIEKPLFI